MYTYTYTHSHAHNRRNSGKIEDPASLYLEKGRPAGSHWLASPPSSPTPFRSPLGQDGSKWLAVPRDEETNQGAAGTAHGDDSGSSAVPKLDKGRAADDATASSNPPNTAATPTCLVQGTETDSRRGGGHAVAPPSQTSEAAVQDWRVESDAKKLAPEIGGSDDSAEKR